MLMRCFLAGLLLLLSLPLTVCAQARGEVESIGLGGLFRPDAYVPMVVRVQADKSGTYQIRVVQEDLDRDQPLFTSVVSLTGAEEGKGAEQRFWMYFLPQPTEGGLPDTTKGYGLKDLQQALKVFLCDEKGRQLVQLPITQTISSLEGVSNGPFSVQRGTKLILAISDGSAQPVWREYQSAMGSVEDVVFVTLRPSDIPEDVRGLEAVDAILWLNAAVPDPAKPSDEKRFKAIQQFVRLGKELVICQPGQRDATAAFGDLMPVTVTQIQSRSEVEPLRTWAIGPWRAGFEEARSERQAVWNGLHGPFQVARATPKPGALIAASIAWDPAGKDISPYLVRSPYGLGAVTWVAEDLSDPALIRAKVGWPFIWDKVFDWQNDTTLIDNRTTQKQKLPYDQGSVADIGQAMLAGMELTSKSHTLVAIAVVFFIAYWMVAGPGIYLFLVTKARSQMSWFLFAASAVVATLLTVAVVKLVVRGAPELSHITLARGGPGELAVQFSRFGLYIPRDGAQEIVVGECAPNEVSYINAFPMHPAHSATDIEFPAKMEYTVPIREAAAGEPVEITVPYRSTLKKFQVHRVGAADGIVDGAGTLRYLDGRNVLQGTITNGTGQRLKNIYIVYHDTAENRADDQILYMPLWEKGTSIDLDRDFDDRAAKLISIDKGSPTGGQPGQVIDGKAIRVKGVMGRPGTDNGWSGYWYSSLRSSGYGANDVFREDQNLRRSFPMLSLFSRLPPMKNPAAQSPDRSDLLRRGARQFDVSPAVAAGKLIVLAESDDKLPLPYELDVDGSKVGGEGTVFYQFELPLDRRQAENPATQPAAASPAAQAPAIPAPRSRVASGDSSHQFAATGEGAAITR